jgi:hypothetical protein
LGFKHVKTRLVLLFVAHEANAWPTVLIWYHAGIIGTFNEMLDSL